MTWNQDRRRDRRHERGYGHQRGYATDQHGSREFPGPDHDYIHRVMHDEGGYWGEQRRRHDRDPYAHGTGLGIGGGDGGTERAAGGRYSEGGYRGHGPRGHKRSPERIYEEVCDRLTDDPYVDASDIEVSVHEGEITLSGTVDSRQVRRRAEDIAESVSGVTHVQNNLRVRRSGATG